MEASYRFFANKACKYYPCHEGLEELNCLFCYCPLYERKHCPGNPEYLIKKETGKDGREYERRIKSCMNCTFPHDAGNYGVMMQFLKNAGEPEKKKKELCVAVMADVHNNHVALEACVECALQKGAQKFIFLGDYVSDCPYPQKTMKLLYELNETYDCTFIRGNREEYILDYEKSSEKNWKPGSASGSLLYNYKNLTKRDMEFFASLKNHGAVEYAGYPKLAICHGSPESAKELMFEGEENTRRILSGLETDYLLSAHTHIQFAWEYQGKQLINPGSVGEPWYYGGKAQFALLRSDGAAWRTELLRVGYDVKQVLREFEESGLNAFAPSWARMSRETICTGVDKSTPVLKRTAELCADRYVWPDYPEELWEQAIQEIWPEMQEK